MSVIYLNTKTRKIILDHVSKIIEEKLISKDIKKSINFLKDEIQLFYNSKILPDIDIILKYFTLSKYDTLAYCKNKLSLYEYSNFLKIKLDAPIYLDNNILSIIDKILVENYEFELTKINNFQNEYNSQYYDIIQSFKIILNDQRTLSNLLKKYPEFEVFELQKLLNKSLNIKKEKILLEEHSKNIKDFNNIILKNE
jgi:hypothetical protein